MSMSRLCRRFLRSEDGATAIEYGLLTTLIAVSLIVGVEAIGNNISNLLLDVNTRIEDADG
ncbi:Flp family type IVb pilin [Rhizobiaceae bacterium BDR2-2]|uniref:Flp family type IVb pilin n=1 Tax=Ectorhizobium quercum TaxID=2965071 RepID=A0AAE3N326_9HYPH|nr:Flp family type IVb pilin [Ectorhizobium quercum]MCX8999973.1 Flp family type IVb pilin [Ectorhizobium quercum]